MLEPETQRFAAEADNHRKARELQTSLVQDMAQAVARVIPTGQLLATRSFHKEEANVSQAIFDDALLAWETDRASIEARLRAYFSGTKTNPQTTLPAAWVTYARAVENLYYLSTAGLPDRCQRTRALESYLGGPVPGGKRGR
jgi:hypothetical protein